MYVIRTRTPTYYTGRLPDSSQVLMGWCKEFIVVIVFSEGGNVVELQKHDLAVDTSKGLGPIVEAAVAKQVVEIQQQLGFRDAPIRVQPFFFDDLGVELKVFPDDLEDFLAHPEDFPEDDAEIYRADIQEWESAGNCVLVWGNDYDLDGEGYTI